MKLALCMLLGAAAPLYAQTPAPSATATPAPKSEDKPKPNVSGYLQVQFSAPFDSNDDGQKNASAFQVRRARLRFKGEVLRNIGYTAMLDAATPNNLLRDGFVSLGFVKHHEIRLGQQKTQFGYENPESSTRLYVVNRALVSDALGRGPDLRDLGVGVLGNWALARGFGLEYGLTLVNGSGPNTTRDETGRKNFWGRFGGRYEDKDAGLTLRLGGSLGSGDLLDRRNTPDPADDLGVDFSRLGLDITADTRWFFAAAELVLGTNEAPAAETDARGAYVVLVGKTKLDLGPILRWEAYSPDTDDGARDQGRITLGAYYDLRPVNVRLLLNYELDSSESERDDVLHLLGQVVF